jgi:hypothetical protein
MKRIILAVAATITLLAGLTTPAGAGDSPAPPPATPRAADGSVSALAGPCGSSYSHVGHWAIKDGTRTLAFMDVYWSSSTKRNCLVTNHASATYGKKMYTEARIRPSGYSWPSCPSSVGCDGGMYSYYAGPVYTPSGVNMSNKCVDFSGWIGWKGRTLYGKHCG